MTFRRLLRLALLALMVGACYLPWFSHPAAALRPGVLDAAEWITLTPAARASTPPLLASLPLRLTLAVALVALAWEVAAVKSIGARALGGIALFGFLFTLFPPFEFFTGAVTDPNYQQQALVFAFALAGAGLATRFSSRGVYGLQVSMALVLVAGGCAVWGVVEGLVFYRTQGLLAPPGAGVILFLAGAALLGVFNTFALLNKKPE